MRTAQDAWHRCAQNADHLAHSSLFSLFFAEVVCTLGTTPSHVGASPPPIGGIALYEAPIRSALTTLRPPIGGNGVIRTATRRRQTDSQLLMLQTPTTIGIGGVAGPGTQRIRGSTGNNQRHAATRSVL